MIPINKEDAKAIREYLPDVHIIRTMKQKSKRGHYFCEESRRTIKFLNALRNRELVEKKVGIKDGYHEKV